jgi:membrane-bound lytic murein transglycosylase F
MDHNEQVRTIDNNASLCRPIFISLAIVIASILFAFNVVPKLKGLSLLEQIQQNGQLVVATRNSPTTYYEDVDGPAGLEYKLAEMFAREIGVQLTLLIPESLDDLLKQLDENRIHIAAAGLTRTREREKIYRFGPTYQHITEQLVYNIANKPPRSLEALDGSLEVVANSSHDERLKELSAAIPSLTWKASTEFESEDLLQMVSDGIIDYTIADSNEISLNQRYLINLRVAFDISEPQPLAWVMPKLDDNSLYLEVHKFFNKIRKNGELKRLIERSYGHVENFDYVGTKIFQRHIRTRLPKFQDLFENAAEQNQLDWRLLAAMGYQESHWDPDAVSPTGVRGIMMLTLKTARDLGIDNRLAPENSIDGGARYFRQTLDRIPPDITEPDRTWMAMAAYNVGLGHLEDARILTQKQGRNPDLWIDVKESLPLLAKRKWYKQTKFGYARGWEPVRYVENIRSYYDILKWIDESNRVTVPEPEEFKKIPNSL